MVNLKSFVVLLSILMITQQWAWASVKRPGAPNKATEIEVTMLILDIDNIDTRNQSFSANIYFEFRWHDPSLKHRSPYIIHKPINQVWHPQLQIVNRQLIWRTFPEEVEITPMGDVTYRQRVWGGFSQALDLRKFPFDTQNFNIIIASPRYTSDQINFKVSQKAPSDIARTLSLPDWEIIKWSFKPKSYLLSDKVGSSAGMVFTIIAKRDVSYYVIKFILPLLFIACMAFLIFWIAPSETSTRISMAATAMLTLIAYRFLMISSLPQVSYLTRMDAIVITATLLVFSVLVVSIISSMYVSKNQMHKANRVDKIFRWVFLVSIILVFILPFII